MGMSILKKKLKMMKMKISIEIDDELMAQFGKVVTDPVKYIQEFLDSYNLPDAIQELLDDLSEEPYVPSTREETIKDMLHVSTVNPNHAGLKAYWEREAKILHDEQAVKMVEKMTEEEDE